MIKVADITVMNLEGAIRGMRNPWNSHDKSDSYYDGGRFVVGKNDLELMHKLYKGGTEHRKFMRQIFVSMSVTAPRYWWQEEATFKIGTTENSESTMHTLMKRPLKFTDFSMDGGDKFERADLDYIMQWLNRRIEEYKKFADKGDKEMANKIWRSVIHLLPQSFNQTREVSMNYEVAANMIRQREGHPLKEWRDFVRILKRLDYMPEIRGEQ